MKKKKAMLYMRVPARELPPDSCFPLSTQDSILKIFCYFNNVEIAGVYADISTGIRAKKSGFQKMVSSALPPVFTRDFIVKGGLDQFINSKLEKITDPKGMMDLLSVY